MKKLCNVVFLAGLGTIAGALLQSPAQAVSVNKPERACREALKLGTPAALERFLLLYPLEKTQCNATDSVMLPVNLPVSPTTKFITPVVTVTPVVVPVVTPVVTPPTQPNICNPVHEHEHEHEHGHEHEHRS